MVQILYGNEPYMIAYFKKKAVDTVENKEFSYKEFSGANEEFYSFVNTASFFGKKLAVLVPETLTELDTEKFRKVLQSKGTEADILIMPLKVQSNTKFYGWCEKQGFLKECKKVKKEDLQKLILREFKLSGGKTITEEAVNELIKRVRYEADEVTLYDVLSDVRTVTYYNNEVTADTVKMLCRDREKENIFILSSLLMKKDLAGIRRQAELIEKSGASPIGVLSAMLRDFRVAYKMKVLEKEIPSIKARKQAVNTWNMPSATGSASQLYKQMEILVTSIDEIKEGKISKETAIMLTVMKMAYL
ncbi:MAG: hypothetical protein IJN92_10000 [Lachnospiraceae bacterium]|nr:hypothetical protein [Lachnospiraceae bacterium]